MPLRRETRTHRHSLSLRLLRLATVTDFQGLQQTRTQSGHIASANGHHNIAILSARHNILNSVLSGSVTNLRETSTGNQLTGHTLNRQLTSRVNIQNMSTVSHRQSLRELLRELASTREQMRLENHVQVVAISHGTAGLQSTEHLGRVVRIVIKDLHARNLTTEGEAAVSAHKLSQRASNIGSLVTRDQRRCKSSRSVQLVMNTGHLQRKILLTLITHTVALKRPRQVRRRGRTSAGDLTNAQVCIRRFTVSHHGHTRRTRTSRQISRARIISTGHHNTVRCQRTHKTVERLKDTLIRLIEIQVVRLNIRHHSNSRAVTHKRAVRLISLSHKNRPRTLSTQVSVHAATSNYSTHRERRLRTQLIKHHRNHGAGRALTVSTGNSNHLRLTHHSGKRLRTMQHTQTLRTSGNKLRIILTNRSRNHHGINVHNVLSLLRNTHTSTRSTQRLNSSRLRTIRTTHRHTSLQHQSGNSAHTRATNTDEVHTAQLAHLRTLRERRVQRCRQHHLKIHQFSHYFSAAFNTASAITRAASRIPSSYAAAPMRSSSSGFAIRAGISRANHSPVTSASFTSRAADASTRERAFRACSPLPIGSGTKIAGTPTAATSLTVAAPERTSRRSAAAYTSCMPLLNSI
ncbi:transposase and inactivated derivative [Rothia mucilaginosa DY-18]|uniref:Transposase and inactivated derivative n=1 Tax=Rothia mucilaginosa (strain DY-18) TaxID=680646 RepID=D2NU53_ROTMD|nr:transposase and inactivated derivative [Rothia mucilaginosa DY-18]